MLVVVEIEKHSEKAIDVFFQICHSDNFFKWPTLTCLLEKSFINTLL